MSPLPSSTVFSVDCPFDSAHVYMSTALFSWEEPRGAPPPRGASPPVCMQHCRSLRTPTQERVSPSSWLHRRHGFVARFSQDDSISQRTLTSIFGDTGCAWVGCVSLASSRQRTSMTVDDIPQCIGHDWPLPFGHMTLNSTSALVGNPACYTFFEGSPLVFVFIIRVKYCSGPGSHWKARRPAPVPYQPKWPLCSYLMSLGFRVFTWKLNSWSVWSPSPFQLSDS